MKNIRNNKGVTMVALVITIIVLLILASISIDFGIEYSNKSKDNKLEAELNMVQHAILEEYAKNKIQSQVVKQNLPGEKIEDYNALKTEVGNFYSKLKTTQYDNNNEYSYYYKFSTQEQFETIGIENSKDTYIVNYETGEVMNITTPQKSDGTLLYVSK